MSVAVVGQRQRIEPPVLGNCQDPSCVAHNIEKIDALDGVRVITSYVEAGSCGQPQCRDLTAVALSEHTGNPDDCPSVCPICFPRALVPVAA